MARYMDEEPAIFTGKRDCVYILQEESDKRAKTCRIKVGRSGKTRINKRIRDLQAGNSRKLQLLKQFPARNGREAEKVAHEVARCKYKWILGEWYNISKNDYAIFQADIEQAVYGH